jgi:hypothetical protein
LFGLVQFLRLQVKFGQQCFSRGGMHLSDSCLHSFSRWQSQLCFHPGCSLGLNRITLDMCCRCCGVLSLS